jgi:predicted ester cyclase
MGEDPHAGRGLLSARCHVTVEDVIAEGDKMVTRYTIRATHQGETEEFGPPTGKQVEGITSTASKTER